MKIVFSFRVYIVLILALTLYTAKIYMLLDAFIKFCLKKKRHSLHLSNVHRNNV